LFSDRVEIHVKAGRGGDGGMSFRREKYVPKGGPDGGDGGDGGEVVLSADPGLRDLSPLDARRFITAAKGGNGRGTRKHGSRGESVVVEVPVGTQVFGGGELVADLAHPQAQVVVAHGGRGGRGNARFASSTHQVPRYAEVGLPGEEQDLELRLKLLADAALVGLPNAGKSSLLTRISNARPKVADYPFTTLVPHLGVVRVGERQGRPDDATEFVLADVPGLIEGAASGRGLGHEFLRHVERARVLCVLLDLSDAAPETPGRQLEVLLGELAAHLGELVDRPRIVVGSKCDVAVAGVGVADVELAISATRGDGIDELCGRLAALVTAARTEATAIAATEPRVHRPVPDEVEVTRRGEGRFEVVGRAALRAVSLSDLTDPGALDELHRRLASLGVDRALARAGAREGDVVAIGELELEWSADGGTPGGEGRG
jgi:GTP-binding protein